MLGHIDLDKLLLEREPEREQHEARGKLAAAGSPRGSPAPLDRLDRPARPRRGLRGTGQLQLIGLSLLAALAMSMALAATASATKQVWEQCSEGGSVTKYTEHQCKAASGTGKWEWNEISGTEGVRLKGTLRLKDTKVPVLGTAEIECNGESAGVVGPGKLGKITEVKITATHCKAIKVCEEVKAFEARDLPWQAELYESEGKQHDKLIGDGKGEPGWKIECKTALGTQTDECLTETEKPESVLLENKLTNGELLVLATFQHLRKAKCSQGGAEAGEVTGGLAISKTNGSGLRTGSGGGVAATPSSLTTSLSGEGKSEEELEVVEGAEMSDSATLSGTNASKATGTVKYYIYSNSECTDLLKEAGTVTVSGKSVPASSKETLSVGTYYWQAVYSGDETNQASTSTCGTEIAVVTAAVTTSLSGEGQTSEEIEVKETEAVKDTATLYGEHTSKATGKVKYKIYSDNECKTLVKEAGEVTVTSGSVPSSSEEKFSPGTYYWQASYSGDSEKPAEKSICGTEVALVQTPTSLTTSLSGGGHSGGEIEVGETEAVKDTATLSGTNASKASGYVTYDIYSDSECKELVAEAGDVSVTSGSVPESEEETLPVGTYYWQASYSGDGSNHGSTSACGAEISVVTAPVTTLLSGEGQSGDEIEVEETEAVKDTATLHGPHVSKATGTVTYKVYSDSACKELVKEAGEVTVTKGSVPASNEEALAAGDYYWQASYSGDSEIPAATSACGTEVAIVRPTKFQYAALGDSFSAGSGALPYYANTNTAAGENENKCYRSAKAYPARVAEALYPEQPVTTEKEVFKRQPRFIFRACYGAVAWNLGGTDFARGQYNEWIEGAPGKWLPTPAQDSWLTLPGGEETSTGPNNNITLVTLTIGGNDAGFSTVAENCIESTNRALNDYLSYSPSKCKEIITEWETGIAKMSGKGPPIGQAEGVASLKEKLPIALQTIHESAPNARIRIPLYPQILDTTRTGYIVVGTIISGLPNGIGVIFHVDNRVPRGEASVALALERLTDKLNQTIASTVQKWAKKEKVNARVIPGTVRAFNGHRLGELPAQLWVNELGLSGFAATPETFHPNCLGYKAMAERVLQGLGRTVPGGWTCP
jgi:lysophospholipase L1-like esterase